MNFGSFQSSGTQYHDLDSYISEALAPGFVNALDSRGITPKPDDVKKYNNFLKSCIRCRNISKTFDGKAVPASLNLTLKISIDGEDVHAIDIKKKGDFIDIEYFGTTYRLHPGQVGDCDIFEKPDDEVLDISDTDHNKWMWAQYMIFKTKEDTIEDRIKDLKSFKF
jgi:hypothetical protein